MTPIVVKFALDDSDLMAFFRFYHKTSPVARRKRIISALKNAGYAFIGAAIVMLTRHAKPSLWIISISLAAIYGVISYFLYPWRLRRYYKKALPEAKPPYFGTEAALSFSDAGIDLTYCTGSSNYVWSAVLKLEQTEDYIYLFKANASALILPKKRLISSMPVDELYDALLQLKNQSPPVTS